MVTKSSQSAIRYSQSTIQIPQSALGIPLPFSERRLILMGLDLLALNGALLLSLALRSEYDLDWRLLIQHPLWFLLLSTLWVFMAYAFDAYDLRVAGEFSTAALAVLKAGVVTAGIYLLIPYLTPILPRSRWLIFAHLSLTLVLLAAGRALYTVVLSRPIFHCRALIIGAGWSGRTIAQAVSERNNGCYKVVGFVDDDPNKQRFTLRVETSNARPENNRRVQHATVQTFKVLGDRHTLPDLVTRHGITTLILAITHEVNGELLQILSDCLDLGVEIVPMPVLYEQLTGRVPVEHLGSNWYVAMPLCHPGTGSLWPLVNRLFDIVSASLGLFFLGLAFPFIAVAIYLDAPGPIFYIQERVGKGGKRFRVYKFRSMIPGAEKGHAVWAKKDDDRVTRVGKLLRKTHVDEFPQFLNILKGEMSAVGPRPERPEFVEELVKEIPFYRVRHAVKPGMAGWGLVKQGYGASKEDALIKLQYDLYYIKHQSLWLDIVILLKTIFDTLTFGGR